MTVQSVLKNKIRFENNSAFKPDAYVYILSSTSKPAKRAELKKIAAQHAYLQPLNDDKRTVSFIGKNGAVWILQNAEIKKGSHQGLLDESVYAWFRDQAGSLVANFKSQQFLKIEFNLGNAGTEILRACVIGMELASYNFLNSYNQLDLNYPVINLVLKNKLDKKLLEKFQIEATSIQLARHLVNLPPNEINPETIEKLFKKELKFPTSVKVDVWDEKKLIAEKMNLLLAVGKGSETPARMIHIKYRPKTKSTKKPIAFVGKGITFDTGGLDIKPSSGMRLMKKDMGGAASVIGLAFWAIHSNYERACDFYLALAENSVDAKSMRPSDLYRSRAGFLVEIDNTDAEGRLVLADVMDVAATKRGADEPEIIIDIATLTGAIKVALGSEVAGLFTNNDQLAQQLQAAGQASGEPNWRMPLVQKYFSAMSSNFADFKNSADGFGGAITAALFLEKFCGGKKWAHLDVYCWNDKPTGALTFAGGSGQPVQSMIAWLKSQK